MFSPSSERVLANSSPMVTDQIRRRSEVSAHYYKDHLEEIEHRLWELDHEWDVERTLQVWDSGATLVFFVLWLFFSPWWMFLVFLVQAFALVHALHGWSPALILVRHLGFRTQGEIEWERYALKDLRTMALPPGSLSVGAPIQTDTAAASAAPAPAPGSTPEGPPLEPAPAYPASVSLAPLGGEAPAAPPVIVAPQVKPVEGVGSVEIQI